MIRYIGIVCSLLFFWSGCQKETIELAGREVPIFTVDAIIGEDTVRIQAGNNGYYLFTDRAEEAERYTLTSFFSSLPGCAVDCEESFGIQFNNLSMSLVDDYFQSADESSFSDEIALPYSVITGDTTVLSTFGYRVHFENRSVTSAPSSNITWDVGSNLGAPFAFTDTFDMLGFVATVQMELEDNGDVFCTSTYTDLVSQEAEHQCFIPLDFELVGDNAIKVLPVGNETDFSYEWDDGSSAPTRILPGDGTYCFAITSVVDGCVNERCVSVYHLGQPDAAYCSAAFSYAVELLQEIELGPQTTSPGVSVIYTTPGGVTYRSDWLGQFAQSQFAILSVDDYEDNEKGQTTKMVRARLNCLLYNESGETVTLVDGNVVFAVAMP